MRYWTICEPKDPENDDWSCEYITLSDEDILKQYWDCWYGKMCEKYGKEHVDTHYSPQECIDDWVIIHWAQESK
jgi:HEPN domain-containing protein